MKSSPTGWIVLTLVCLSAIFAAGVAGQVKPPPPTYDQTAAYQGEFHCHELMVKQLYAATDITDPAQDKYLASAEAYRLLQEAGQGC